ncbi:MAG TPA: cytochrome c oxidase subunit II [Methylomirabilota bacterium]|nr:cytochrome c oxidase subunit II [Methylomirabilota bacterium]
MVVARRGAFLATLAAGLFGANAAHADSPQPWEIGFQPWATPVMERVESFHNYVLMPIITIITLFVLGLLVYVMWRFNEKRNPTPSKTSHYPVVEVLWTVIPVLILVFIAFKSFPLLYFADRAPDATMTLKAIGHQWYWSYELPDNGDIKFDATLNTEATGDKRLLETDNHVLLPINTKVRLLTTAEDVIHSWAMPSFGVKLDAVPGRLNETWIEIVREGIFYGQCSELCGNGHGYMPIVVEGVTKEKFDAWVQQKKAAMNGGTAPTAVAQNAAN